MGINDYKCDYCHKPLGSDFAYESHLKLCGHRVPELLKEIEALKKEKNELKERLYRVVVLEEYQ